MDQLLFIPQRTYRLKILIWFILQADILLILTWTVIKTWLWSLNEMQCTASEWKNPTGPVCAVETKPKTNNPNCVR